MTELPAVIAEIAEVAGTDAAWALAVERGGREVFIPAKSPDDHWLSKLVGADAADAICKHFSVNGSGVSILIPMARTARTRTQMAKALAEGKSVSETAGRLGVHERTVYRAKRRARRRGAQSEAEGQGDLF